MPFHHVNDLFVTQHDNRGISVTGFFRFRSGDLQALGGDNRGAAGQSRANPA
jgi:hypothetical protein